MTTHNSEYDIRGQKRRDLAAAGINPYPGSSQRTKRVSDFLAQFDATSAVAVTLGGRLRLKREHGKLMFCQLQDESGIIQVVLSKADGPDAFDFASQWFDVGDIVQITGRPFVTKKGEQSIIASAATLLSKALRPLPDKWHGIQDTEDRYRHRYLDMIFNPELRDMFVKKARFWNSMRQFLLDEGFLEVETPVLESTPGGADAEPFMTHHNALDIDLYLRISMGELWQKRAMVAGFEKTFEIGRQFRNEGLSPEHLQDYTQMEFYWGYADYRQGMQLVQRMYTHVIQATFGRLQFQIDGNTIHFDQEWPELDYVEAIQDHSGIDVISASDVDIRAAAQAAGATVDATFGRGRMIDYLWKQVRKTVVGPVFLVNHPVDVSPLAKRNPSLPGRVEQFQVVFAGSEVGRGYSELNDPVDQAERFAEQAKLREAGDSEAQMHDADFVEALEYGMPPTCGFGVSERLFSFLMDKPIKECVMFPLLRPKSTTVATVDSPVSATKTTGSHVTEPAGDPSLADFAAGITSTQADDWMQEQLVDPNLRRHSLATGVIMRALAKHFGAANPDNWYVAGVLHDIDYENCQPEQHSLVGEQLCAERGIHPLICAAVKEHNFHHNFTTTNFMSTVMMCLEQLTGLIAACTFVRPDKNIASVKLSSVKKKLKDKSFAAGVDRAMISQVEALTGLSLDQAIDICLSAMQAESAQLTLTGNN